LTDGDFPLKLTAESAFSSKGIMFAVVNEYIETGIRGAAATFWAFWIGAQASDPHTSREGGTLF
jgi:hypothetical protein